MELWQRQSLFALNVAKLINFIKSKGYNVTLGEAFRTPEQAKIYANEGKGIVNSLHCKRLAIDLNLITSNGIYLPDDDHYIQFGSYWESLDGFNRWGGHFKRCDGNHFEMQD